jgi:tetratricopeptide (TPR) repeat protein
MTRSSFLILAAAASLSAGPAARAQDSANAADEQFGKVHFTTSCNGQAQRRFDRAMRYQHSFWHRESREIFEETLKADPECAMAYWGIALSLRLNPHIPPPKDNLALGLANLAKAKSMGAKTQRERDYIDALLVFYADHDTVPHAQHMPSHIFTRVGYWKESIASNAASARAAKAGKEFHDQLHAMDYLVYAHLQLAQDKQAREVVAEMIAVKGYNPNVRTGPYAVAASQARYMIERGDWNGAAGLQIQPSQFAYADAVTHFARALGAARSGNLDSARGDIAKLGGLREKLTQANDAYWSEQVDIQWQVATAWLLNGENKQADALRAMSAAADAEDKTEKSIVTPGPLAPARELYGAMLLERGMAKEALAAFEATLNKEPNRLGATIGAAKAAEKTGDAARARQYFAKVIALADGAGESRAEVADARAFMTRH